MKRRTDNEWKQKLLEIKDSDWFNKEQDFKKGYEKVDEYLKEKGSSAREFSDLKKSLKEGTATKKEEAKYIELKEYLSDRISGKIKK